MQTIVLASRKGGVGKTTLSGHIAVEAERAEAGPAVLIDMDEQGSLSAWWNARQSDTPQCAKVGSDGLAPVLDTLRGAGARLVVIDTPPYATAEIARIVREADLVVIPVKPSPHDLRAVVETIEVVRAAGKPFVFVLNEASTNGLLTLEALRGLSRHGHVAAIIRTRQDFRAAMIDGRTVGEAYPKGRSAEEIGKLWVEIREALNGPAA